MYQQFMSLQDEFFTLSTLAKASVDKLEESILQAHKAVDTRAKLFIFVIYDRTILIYL